MKVFGEQELELFIQSFFIFEKEWQVKRKAWYLRIYLNM